MEGRMIGFILVVLIGLLFMGVGLSAFRSEKPAGFWANAATVPMEDVKSYNRAVGKLWCAFAAGFVLLLGLPMCAGEGSPLILLSCIGIMYEVIAVIVVYMRIEKKYRRK